MVDDNGNNYRGHDALHSNLLCGQSLLHSWGAFLFLDENGGCHLHSSGVAWFFMVFEFYWWFNLAFVAMFVMPFFGIGLNFVIHSLCTLKM